MTSVRRWLIVLAGTALLVALPGIVAALPAPARHIPAVTLLHRIQHSADVGFSGYAESDGGLALPVTDQFGNLPDLFAGLRIRPTNPASTVDHLDVWADPDTGLPLSVSVYGKGSGSSALTSKFLDVTVSTPSQASTLFSVPAGADVQSVSGPDLATSVD